MASVYIVEAEHPIVPGRVLKACATFQRAEREAIAIVELLPKQGRKHPAAPDNWQAYVEQVQDEYGAAHTYVEITVLEILP